MDTKNAETRRYIGYVIDRLHTMDTHFPYKTSEFFDLLETL
jgi:hypothetical protein